ncbi:MAG: serpin family protein [Candidatus Thermoplasmatota archaeon]|nr:serpin family protein [Candidatus Thermoplasmatota archaeon]
MKEIHEDLNSILVKRWNITCSFICNIRNEGASLFSEEEPTPIEFRADHPFIFFIEHKATGQILFMGKVENPSP